ncbi:DNA gyrase inhibitor YacG [Breoghania sp. JC706]|uniref:DNA gyrase inhibitor YacG n=1 Tax=Breoghania sp. JC706 TaxID=3117732 RepID=UPI00300AE332
MTTHDNDNKGQEPARPPRPCPNCSKLSVDKYYPFCSARCADVDLNRWLSGSYAIPAVELDDVDPDDPETY